MRSEGTVIGFVCLFVLANNSLVVSLFLLQMTQLTNKGVKFCGISSALLQNQSPSSIFLKRMHQGFCTSVHSFNLQALTVIASDGCAILHLYACSSIHVLTCIL